MNPNWAMVFTLVACVGTLLLPLEAKLKLAAVFSFVGTYVVGGAGGLRLLPGPMVGLSLIVVLAIFALGTRRLSIPRFRHDIWLWIFAGYSLLITIVVPQLFAGQIEVIRPGLIAEGIREAVPLAWSSSTVAQIAYLLMALILVLAGIYVSRSTGYTAIKSMVRFQIAVAICLAALVLVEATLGVLGVSLDVYNWLMGPTFTEPRPDRYALGEFFGLPIRRAQAVFGEPSYFAVYMVGIWGGLLLAIRFRRGLGIRLGAGVVFLSLIAAFSTTAVFGMAVVTLLAALAPVRDVQVGRKKERVRWVRIIAVFGTLAFMAGAITTIMSSSALSEYLFGKLTDTEGYTEGNYSSGAERLYWDLVAAQAFVDSWGLGVGAGGTRASSFFLNITAAFGIPGLILLATLGMFLIRQVCGRMTGAYVLERRVSAMLCIGWLLAMGMAVPDGLIFFYVWIQVGLLIGAETRLRYRPSLMVAEVGSGAVLKTK